MKGFEVNKRSVGVNFHDGKEADVMVWAPLLEKLELVLKEKDEHIRLHKDAFGYWTTKTSALQPGDRYTFLVEEEQELPDPASLSQPDGVHGPSQAIDVNNYQWQDLSWTNLPLEEYIIYELHTGTFSPAGNFEGVMEKLDHLKELGINAIEIMPVAQFPGNRNWGYDGVFPFAVQHSYGGVVGLQQLVDACHQKGFAVILDVVYNHLGPEGNYFGTYGPYFTNKYNTPWGPAINFDDAYCDAVRNYFIENALMWFRDFHIDALRLDAVHAIKDFSPVHILKEIRQHVDEWVRISGGKHYLIVELDLNDNKFINPIDRCGYGMDAQWIDEFHHALRIASGGDRHGYYEDFTGIKDLAKAYQDAYVYDGIYSPHRKKVFGTTTKQNPGKQFIVFSQNHDHVGNRMMGERSSQLVSFEMQKLMASAIAISPFIPMFFMGEEWSEPSPFLYFVSHTDPHLVQAVREGRKREFAAFYAAGEAPDPISESSFLQSKLQWELLDKEPHKTLYRYYKELIQLRKTQPALKTLDRQQVKTEVDESKKLLLLQRDHAQQQIYCILNFSKHIQQVSLPSHIQKFEKLIDSSDASWGGNSEIEQHKEIIQPESVIIYASKVFA